MDLGAGLLKAHRQGAADEAQASGHQNGATVEGLSINAPGAF
jgi:hypothetical protein